jgi:hypothetical protein
LTGGRATEGSEISGTVASEVAIVGNVIVGAVTLGAETSGGATPFPDELVLAGVVSLEGWVSCRPAAGLVTGCGTVFT